MSLLATRRCAVERRFSEGAREGSARPCGMRFVLMRETRVCACCDLGCYPDRER